MAALGRHCADAGVPYAVDACQALGQFSIDVVSLRCDFLTASARKFLRGPRGVGFLYVGDRALESGSAPLLCDMRGADSVAADAFELQPDARRYEYWEFAYALVLGLGEAARYALDAGIERTGARARQLAASLRRSLASLPRVRVLDRGETLCAIVSFEVAGIAAVDVVAALQARGVNASWTPRTSATIDMDEKGTAASVRLSPHYYNTLEELELAVDAVARL